MAGGYGGRVARQAVGMASGPSPAAGPSRAEGLPPAPAPGPASTAEASTAESRSGPTPRAEPEGRWARAVPALRERLPMWVQLRCGLEPRALAALAVVLVAAAVFAAMHFWSARPEGVRAPDPLSATGHAPVPRGAADPVADGAGAPAPSPGPPPAAGGTGGRIVVDVSGKVRRPGIHRLPSGARVADALRAAGGVRPGVDLDGLNRARVLVDGEQILVGVPPGTAAAGGTEGGGAGPTAAGGTATGPVSLNSATAEQLEALPGVGPVLAQHIVDYRAQHGGFRSVGELREVTGIGDRRFADLQSLVRP